MMMSGLVTKYVWVINKIGMPCMLIFSQKIKILAFSSLGELFNSSLATEKPRFWQLTIWTQDYINHRKLINYVFGRAASSGLGELLNSSLATKNPSFR